MNLKSFEYRKKDISMLKKDATIRTISAILFALVAIWQICLLVSSIKDETLSGLNIISACAVFFFCFVFALVSLLQITKNARTINVITAKGKCVSSVNILFSTEKTGFMKMYSIVTKVIAVLCLVVLFCSITSAFLQAKFMETMSFYLPLLVALCLVGLYSSHHVDMQITAVKTVDEFNRIY